MPPRRGFATCEICGVHAGRTGQEKRKFMAKFPLDENRCRQWVQNVGKEDLVYVPIEKLHQLKYVCEDHFDSDDFNKKKSRLKKTAVPQINLKVAPLPDEMLHEFPCHIASDIQDTDEFIRSEHILEEQLLPHEFGGTSRTQSRNKERSFTSEEYKVIDAQSGTKKCHQHKTENEGPLHAFPNPQKLPEKFKEWAQLVTGQDNCDIDYKRMRICDRHFTERDRNRYNRLNALAVPSLFLQDTDIEPFSCVPRREVLAQDYFSLSQATGENTVGDGQSPTETDDVVDDDALGSYSPTPSDMGTQKIAEGSKENESTNNKTVTQKSSATPCETTSKIFTEKSVATLCRRTKSNDQMTVMVVNRIYSKPLKKPDVQEKDPNKKQNNISASIAVLKLQLIDDSKNDELVYEILPDKEPKTKVNRATQSTEVYRFSQEHLSRAKIVESGISKENQTKHEMYKNIGHWKVKLAHILHKTEFCGICLNADNDLNATDDSFEIIDNETTHRQTLRRIVDTVFKETEYRLANSLICQSCTKKLIQSYIFIRNAEETSKMLNFHLDELYNKTSYIRNKVLEDSNRTDSDIFNVVIALDKGISNNFTSYKMETNESSAQQKKICRPRLRRTVKCRSCNLLLPSYRAWKVHEASTHKKYHRCKICLQNFKTRQEETIHYRMHFKTRCTLCHKIVQDGKLLQHTKRLHKHSIHLCSTCNIVFYSAKALESHNNKRHNRGNSKCVTCLESLTEVELGKHQCRFKCPECLEAPCVHHKYLMSYREQTLNLADRARCLDCSYVCISKVALITHVNERHLNVQPYSCARCELKFYCRSELVSHVCDSEEMNQFIHICEYCDKRFDNQCMWQQHRENCQHIKRQFQCEFCPANFDSSKDLSEHRKRKHGNNFWSCALCDRVFLNDLKKKMHILQAHTKQTKNATRSIDCVVCQAKFTTKAAFLLHLRYHRAGTKYPCGVCKTQFDTVRQFRSHNCKREHSMSKCGICDEVMRRVLLKKHISAHSSGALTCKTCGKSFQAATSLRYHQKRHPRNVTCPKCKKLINNAKLWRHYRSHLIRETLDLKTAGKRCL